MTTPAGPPPTMVPEPTDAEIRAWLKLTAEQLSDHDLGVIRAGEIDNQRRECRVTDAMVAAGELPADLAASLYRRCARACAARGLPLGYRSGDGEFGPQLLPTYDAEITRYERPWRKFAFG